MPIEDLQYIKDKNLDNLYKQAADKISQIINQTLVYKQFVVIALSATDHTLKVFEHFKSRNDIPWQDVHIFLFDEFLYRIDSDKTKYKKLYDCFIESLLKVGVLDQQNIHTFNFSGNINLDLQNYKTELLKISDRFDIVVTDTNVSGDIVGLEHFSFSSSDLFSVQKDLENEDIMVTTKALFKLTSACILFVTTKSYLAINNLYDSNLKNSNISTIISLPDVYIFTDLV